MVTVIGSFWSIRYKDRLLEVKIHSTIEDDNSQLIYAADFRHYFVKSNWTQDSWAKKILYRTSQSINYLNSHCHTRTKRFKF